jgi:hypothetical protein
MWKENIYMGGFVEYILIDDHTYFRQTWIIKNKEVYETNNFIPIWTNVIDWK